MNDEAVEPLLEKLCQGDMDMAKEVFLAYETHLRQFVRRQLPQRMRAKFDSVDIVQSVWADLLHGFRAGAWHFPDARHFHAFLVRATRNRFYDRFRQNRAAYEKEQRLGDMHSSEMPTAPTPHVSGAVAADELWEKLLSICAPEHRDLLQLKRDGLPMEELIERTGLHPGSIRRIFRNLARTLALQQGAIEQVDDG